MSEDIFSERGESGLEKGNRLSFGEIQRVVKGEFALRHVSGKQKVEREAREGFMGDGLSLADVSGFSLDPLFWFKVRAGILNEEERQDLGQKYGEALRAFLKKSIGLDVFGGENFAGFILFEGGDFSYDKDEFGGLGKCGRRRVEVEKILWSGGVEIASCDLEDAGKCRALVEKELGKAKKEVLGGIRSVI